MSSYSVLHTIAQADFSAYTKKPQAFAEGPPGQNGVNTDGTWNIKG